MRAWKKTSFSLAVAAKGKGRPPQDDAPYNSRCAGAGKRLAKLEQCGTVPPLAIGIRAWVL